jgi:hypothetical protein
MGGSARGRLCLKERAGQPLQKSAMSASPALLIACPNRSAYRALKKLEFRSIMPPSNGGFYNHILADLDPRFLRDVSAFGAASCTRPARIHSANHSTGERIILPESASSILLQMVEQLNGLRMARKV